MKIGERKFKQLFKALFGKQHYIALTKMFLVCQKPFDCFGRYFFGWGEYPIGIELRTPLGKIKPLIYSYQDMITVNEIFFRTDYALNRDAKVVVDIGSNIGISALFFLTRNNFCKTYLFEPDPRNTEKLKNNLEDYTNRYIINESAVSDETGIKKFGRDVSGRYGGLSRETGDYIEVKCLHINEALDNILKLEKEIDVLKLDIEGEELKVLQAIDQKYLEKIKTIYFEIDFTVTLEKNFSFRPEIFKQDRYGEVYILKNKLFRLS